MCKLTKHWCEEEVTDIIEEEIALLFHCSNMTHNIHGNSMI